MLKSLLLAGSILLSASLAPAATTSLRPPQEINAATEASIVSDAGFSMNEARRDEAKKLPQNQVAPTPAQIAGKYMALGYTTTTAAKRYWLDIEVADGNNLLISNLMGKGTTIPATWDAAREAIVVKPQFLFSDPEYGDFMLYVASIDKKQYYPNLDLEFFIQPDGSLITGNWGAFVVKGEHAGAAEIHHKEILFPAKATVTDYSLTKTGDEAVNSYSAVFVRESDNKILLKNFYNYGADLVLTVDSAGNISAPRTLLAQATGSSGGIRNYYNYKVTDWVSASSYKLANKPIEGKWVGKEIQLGRWALAQSTTISSVYDLLEKSVIAVPEEFTPFSSALTLQGAGTAENPYIVASAKDLESLSAAVNYSGRYTVSKKAFEGKYFRQTADIDMTEVLSFEPIGFDKNSTFAGHYDGENHTISNLKVNRRDESYAGLFGFIEAGGSVRNLILESPKISCTKSQIGALAGQTKSPIYNITVRNAEIGDGTTQVGGIVGNTSTRVANCSFTGKINCGSTSGGIAGQANGSIIDCFSAAQITLNKGNGMAGGIVGSAAGDSVMISGCHFDGIITDRFGSTTLGGISGFFQIGKITGCLNSGTIYSKSVSTNTTVIGGLTGLLSAATISDCHFSGRLESPDAKTIVGLAGKVSKAVSSVKVDEPKIMNSLVTGTIICSNSMTGNEFIGPDTVEYLSTKGLYYDSQTSGRRGIRGAIPTSTLASGQRIGDFSEEIWKFEKDMYPALKSLSTTDGGILAASPFFLATGEESGAIKSNFRIQTGNGVDWFFSVGGQLQKQGNGLKIDGDNVCITAQSICNDTIVAIKGDAYKSAILKIMPPEFEGAGTAENPYLIKSAEDIYSMRNAVDMQGMRFTGVYFRMANDIDMGGDTGFIGLSSQGAEGAFNGTFDGAGHRIKNWIVDRARLVEGKPSVDGAQQLMAGFFLFTGPEATIRNLILDKSCSVLAGYHVGGLVSQNYGRIENCVNEASVTALFNEVGAIAAYNAEGAVVAGCLNTGAVSCGRTIGGGLVGANLGEIDKCQNEGYIRNDMLSTISPKRNLMGSIGGIAGYNAGTVSNCLGSGTIDAPRICGAIVGENREGGKILSSLVTAILYDADDPDCHGAIMGRQHNSTDTLAGVYYDVQLSATTAGNHSAQRGATGLTTTELTNGKLPQGFDAEIWSAEMGRYPMLASFEGNEVAIFNASSYIICSRSGRNDSRFFMRRAARIAAPEDASVSLLKNELRISGQVLSLSDKSGIQTDTLRIDANGMTRKIPVFAATGILTDGDGSESKPYLIKTPADWNTVATFSNENRLDLKDEHFRIEENLNFSGKEFSPICATGVVRFQGEIDGNGKSIDNLKVAISSADAGKNLALVGILGEFGSIHDLTLGEASSLQGSSNVGAFAGQNAGLISNCINKAEISALGAYAGGMAGYVISGGRFIDCTNYGKISVSQGQAGGIAGGNGSDIGGLIQNSHNHGAITSLDRSAGGIIGSSRVDVVGCTNDAAIVAKDVYAGGIVGYHTYTQKILDCSNKGKVTAEKGIAGGIAGFMFFDGRIANCVNSGTVRSLAAGAGGIVGATYRAGTEIENCVNRGAVSALATHSGGIVGQLTAGTDSLTMNRIRSCTNYGKVVAADAYSGGVVGEAKIFTRLLNLRNFGDVEGDSYVGGIAGCMLGKADTCLNIGEIMAKRYSVGGIVGVTNTASTITASISNALNAGAVRSLSNKADEAFNVGGILGGGNVKIDHASNFADLSGHKAVGGIVGLAVRGTDTELAGLNMGTCVSNSFSVGSIDCLSAGNENYCGHIIGNSANGLAYTKFSDNFYDLQHGSKIAYATDELASAIGLATSKFAVPGTGFTVAAEGCYPVLKAFATDSAAMVAISAIHLVSEDTRHNVKGEIRLVAPQGVNWESSDFSIEGNTASWSNLKAGELYGITARAGEFSRTFWLAVGTGSDVKEVDMGSADVVAEEWYSLDGRRLSGAEKGVNIRVVHFSNGLRRTEKVVCPNK